LILKQCNDLGGIILKTSSNQMFVIIKKGEIVKHDEHVIFMLLYMF